MLAAYYFSIFTVSSLNLKLQISNFLNTSNGFYINSVSVSWIKQFKHSSSKYQK